MSGDCSVDQSDFIRHTIGVLHSLEIPYAVVGSFACLVHGERRNTQDIDIVVELPMSKVAEFCAAFPSKHYFVSEQAVRDAVNRRFQFNVLCTTSGDKLDAIFPPPGEWGIGQIARSRVIEFAPELSIAVASPEDTILGKLWYYNEGRSEKHLRDIAGILEVSGDRIDKDFIADWAAKMGYLETWQAILQKLGIR
jgi:hypothetical protein